MKGGSFQYRDRLIKQFQDKIKLNSPVTNVKRNQKNGLCDVTVTTESGHQETYDIAIIAAHSDQAYAMLDKARDIESQILPFFKYEKNIATIHTDETVMPKTKACWSSWNFVYKPSSDGSLKPSTVYYMNKLQGVSDHQNYFVSINGANDMSPDSVLKTIEYHHPIFDTNTFKLQNRFTELNSEGPVYFTGAYQANGFHEDGLKSSYDLCNSILGRNVL